MAVLQNKAGKYIVPTIASGQAALSAAKLPEDLIVWVSDPEGDDAYPIVTYTWIMTYKKYADPKKAAALKDVLDLLPDGGPERERIAGLHPFARQAWWKKSRRPWQISAARRRTKIAVTARARPAVRGSNRSSMSEGDSWQSATEERASIARPPTRWERVFDLGFRGLTYIVAVADGPVGPVYRVKIGYAAAPAIKRWLRLLHGNRLGSQPGEYGIRPQIWGTLYSSVLAVIIGTVLGLAVAIFLSERMLSTFVFRVLRLLRRPPTAFGAGCRTAWKRC